PRWVEHQRVAVTYGAAHSAADLDIRRRVGGRVDLVCRPPFRIEPHRLHRVFLPGSEHRRAGVRGHAIAIGTEQAMNRHARYLPRDVPERDVQRANGPEGRRAVLVPEGLVEALSFQRVLAHHHGFELLNEGFTVEGGAAHCGSEESVALDALVGPDGDEAELASTGEAARMPAVRSRWNAVPGKKREREVCDLHVRSPAARVAAFQCPSLHRPGSSRKACYTGGMTNSRLVYSSEGGPFKDADPRRTTSRGAISRSAGLPDDGIIRITRDRGGRGGKVVTVVHGMPERGPALDARASELRRLCGAGGTVKGAVIEIQGDHRDRVAERLRALGYA